MTATRTRTSSKPKVDAFQAVTDKILDSLEQGVAPWRKPWGVLGVQPKSLSTGKHYRGVNHLLLGLEQADKGYRSPYWLTFNQMTKLGGKLKGEKGSQKGTLLVFWKMLKTTDKNTGEPKNIPFLKYFYVFNVDQTEGIEKLPEDAYPVERLDEDPSDRHARAQAIADGYKNGPKIVHGGDKAYYVPSTDVLTVPVVESFHGLDEYYSTLFHELGHSTGHESRLNRPIKNEFGSHAYGREELVAEMTDAFLCAEAGIESTHENSAAYLQSWITTIREDARAVVVAAGAAQKAADRILGRDREKEADEVAEAVSA